MKEWNDSRFFNLASKYYFSNQNFLLSFLDEMPGAELLDIGCGNGDFTLMVAQRLGTQILNGIDINNDCLEEAQSKGIEVKCHDIDQGIPYKNESIDVIVSNQVVEHIFDVDSYFREIYRILRKDGYAIISTPNLSSLHNLIFINLGMQPPGLHISEIQVGNFLYGTRTHGHIRLFSISALKDLAKYHNFKIEKITGFGMYPFPLLVSNILSKAFARYCVYLNIKIRK